MLQGFKKIYLQGYFLSFHQSITTTNFQVCLKDIQRYDARHDPVTLNYMAAGCKYATEFLSRLTAFRLAAQQISAMLEEILVHETLMTIPHRLRYALGPPNCLGPLHTSRQRPTRRFEIYHCQISPDKPLLWQTCLNSPHASQQVKIFYRPTKNRLVCASLRPVFNQSIGKLNQSDHSSQSLTKDTGNPVNYLTLTGCPGILMGLDIQLAPRVFSTKF